MHKVCVTLVYSKQTALWNVHWCSVKSGNKAFLHFIYLVCLFNMIQTCKNTKGAHSPVGGLNAWVATSILSILSVKSEGQLAVTKKKKWIGESSKTDKGQLEPGDESTLNHLPLREKATQEDSPRGQKGASLYLYPEGMERKECWQFHHLIQRSCVESCSPDRRGECPKAWEEIKPLKMTDHRENVTSYLCSGATALQHNRKPAEL